MAIPPLVCWKFHSKDSRRWECVLPDFQTKLGHKLREERKFRTSRDGLFGWELRLHDFAVSVFEAVSEEWSDMNFDLELLRYQGNLESKSVKLSFHCLGRSVVRHDAGVVLQQILESRENDVEYDLVVKKERGLLLAGKRH